MQNYLHEGGFVTYHLADEETTGEEGQELASDHIRSSKQTEKKSQSDLSFLCKIKNQKVATTPSQNCIFLTWSSGQSFHLRFPVEG